MWSQAVPVEERMGWSEMGEQCRRRSPGEAAGGEDHELRTPLRRMRVRHGERHQDPHRPVGVPVAKLFNAPSRKDRAGRSAGRRVPEIRGPDSRCPSSFSTPTATRQHQHHRGQHHGARPGEPGGDARGERLLLPPAPEAERDQPGQERRLEEDHGRTRLAETEAQGFESARLLQREPQFFVRAGHDLRMTVVPEAGEGGRHQHQQRDEHQPRAAARVIRRRLVRL